MDQFWEEFETGEIHFRDKWQFELKSDFIPHPNLRKNIYTQEFFLFIPNALQVNSNTYTKADFFHDQTNLIRFKTPRISLAELIDPQNSQSPFKRIRDVRHMLKNEAVVAGVERELKLLANIIRSALRREVYPMIQKLEKAETPEQIREIKSKIEKLLGELKQVREQYDSLKKSLLEEPGGLSLINTLSYIQDIISVSINSSMTGLLETVRNKHNKQLDSLDDALVQILLTEKRYREGRLEEPTQLDTNSLQNESILYQSGLLNKFVMDALQLETKRLAMDQKFRSIIGSLAAALAMLLYLLLFIWQGFVFVINSLPFVLFTVIIYVLKDRLKEELKNLSYRQVFKWFPDYTTEILSPSGKFVIGRMHETFTFINENEVPLEIGKTRIEDFHTYLETIKRPEQVIYYKKTITLYENPNLKTARLNALNIIFRHDIHKFMQKASNAYESYETIDSETLEIVKTPLPKVYHINIILKNSYLKSDSTQVVELKKFRLVVDKEGIKRVESVSNNHEKKNGTKEEG